MSILNVDKIQPIGGGSTITVDATDIQASTGTIRASTFSGDISATGIGVTSLNIAGVTTTTDDIKIDADNKNLKIGAGEDLSLFHNGTDSRIVNTTGDLSIRGNSLKLASTTGEEYVRCTANGSVDLFHDNVVKLTTNTDGYRSNDNVKAQFGNAADLTIFHDGSHSRIYNSTGNLSVRSAVFDVLNADGSERMFKATADSGCELFFNGNSKVQTRTGDTLFLDDIRIGDNLKINVGTLDDLQIFHDGSHNYILGATGDLILKNSTANYVKGVTSTGAVELYHNGSLKLSTGNNGINVTGSVSIVDSGRYYFGSSNDAYLYHDGSNTHFYNGTGHLQIRQTANSDVITQTNAIDRVRIYNDGLVAIGQSSKSSTAGAGNLDIQGNATSCIIEMGNPFPTYSGGVVPEFRLTATNSSHTVDFESVWGGDNLLHKHLAFSGGSTIFYKGTNNDEVARFNSNKFGVGTDSPGQLIHTHSGSSSGGLAIQSNGSTNYIAAIQTANNFVNGSTAGGLVIRSGNGIEFSGNDGSTVQMRLASGNLTIGDGNLVVASGHGIDFSATGDGGTATPSELFDDYEEGSWQPTWSPASGSIGHQSRHGDYIKVGKVVHCMFAISANGSTNPSGELKVSGLPFTATIPNAQGLRGGGGVAFAGYHMNTSVTKCMAQGTNVHIILADNSRLQSNSSGMGYGYNAAQLSGMFSYITS